MTIQDKINLFINRAQTKIAELSTTVASDLSEAFVDSANIDLAIELIDAVESLQSETLQWTDYEKELVVDYYSYKAKLSDIAIVDYSEYVNNIAGNSISNSAWVAPFTALTQKVDANYQEFLDEIARLDTRIDNLDLSTLIPQYLLDEIAANSAARHEHANKTVLDQVTQGHLDAIANNTNHRNNSAIHVTAIQKQNWDAKITAQQLIDGLAGKANVSHTHLMSEIEGLLEALNSLQPEKGDKGDQGDSPRIILGEVTVGETLSITIDDTDPLNVIFNFTIPVDQDGKDFKIEVFGAAAGRLSTLYNNVEEGYTYLGTDNGYLYFRKPFDSLGNAIPATTTTGWTSAKFLGSNGWSPVIGLLEVSDTLVVQVLKGWTGGTDAETKPTIGSDPSYLVYLGPNGFTYLLEEAINVKGSQGIAGPQGKIMFPDASGVFADRANYDLESAEFVFLDTETGLIYKKLSSTSGNWSPGYQWKGDKGDQGEPGTAGSEAIYHMATLERDAEDSHPRTAITGLEQKLAQLENTFVQTELRYFRSSTVVVGGVTYYETSKEPGGAPAVEITSTITASTPETAQTVAQFIGLPVPEGVTFEVSKLEVDAVMRKSNTSRNTYVFASFASRSADGVITELGVSPALPLDILNDIKVLFIGVSPAYIPTLGSRAIINIKMYQSGGGGATPTGTILIENNTYSRWSFENSTEGVFSNWTEDTTGYIKPTGSRKVKADKIVLDVTTFNGNLDSTITDVQKLAEAVDGLQAGSTSTIQPEVSWDGSLKTISIGDSNTEKLAVNDTVVSGTIRINYPTDAATVSRTKTLILNNSLNSSNVTITWDTVSGTNYFDWIFGKDINLVKAGEIIYIKLENTSNNTVRLLSGKVLDDKVISTQDLPSRGLLVGATQDEVNKALANPVERGIPVDGVSVAVVRDYYSAEATISEMIGRGVTLIERSTDNITFITAIPPFNVTGDVYWRITPSTEKSFVKIKGQLV